MHTKWTVSLSLSLSLTLSLFTSTNADYPYQHPQTSAHHYGVDCTDNHTHEDDNGNGVYSSLAMKPTLITVIISYDELD